MNKTKILLQFSFFVVFFFSVSAASAQSGVIKGKIADAKTNETLIGATVVIEGTTTGSAADLDGNFIIPKAPAGTHTLIISSVGYRTLTKTGVVVENGRETSLNLLLTSEDIVLEAVEVVARANRESEAVLLLEQRQALVATQSVGVRELSRKGIGDAQAAVAQVSGVSHQEGVKNVFVRGLGDRYNITLLNGFPIPSEDPEYKNIALKFFGTDVIQNIGVSKVFSANDYSDVGGAIIDITSKKLVGDAALGIDLSGGVNISAVGVEFLRPDGSNYFGFSNTQQPSNNRFNFPNSLDPSVVSFPVNHGFGAYGGKLFRTGEKQNPLSFFVTASHDTHYSFTKETVRNTNAIGTIYRDQTGKKYSQNISQLILANAMYDISNKHHLQYNFMLIHASEQYVGEYDGMNGNKYDQPDYLGILLRQQINDNLLLVNQLNTDWELTKRLRFEAGGSYNSVKGLEPDRRINNFSKQLSGNYNFTRGDEQRRSFSELTDKDFNVKAGLTCQFTDRFGSDNSALKIGYNGRFSDNAFEAIVYGFTNAPTEFNPEGLKLDDWFNQASQVDERPDTGKQFRMKTGTPDSYRVTKNIHSGYAEVSYRLLRNLNGNIGLRMDNVDMEISYKIQGFPGEERRKRNFFLPGLNLKYDVNSKNTLRLGAGKTYTLPQDKEISPYQYVNISFVSQGNPKIKHSENYNVDLKWDFYISQSELFSLTGFYKHIINPIGRVDVGNSAGMLTYDNISNTATVGGLEMEVRKNLFDRFNVEREKTNKLSVGLSASYIYTSLKLDIINTRPRSSRLEGASPFLANLDVSYNYTQKDKNLTAALVLNYFSNRIHTLGALDFKDIIEEGAPTLDFVASYKFNKRLGVKAKATNLLNPSFVLTRKTLSGEKITLNEYKKGQNISLGISYEF
jgi:hypothetical protein